MEEVEKPVVVNPSPVADQTATAARDWLLVLSALPALIAVLGTRDVKQIVDFIAGTQFAPALGVIIGAAVLLWRQVIARRAKATLVTVATAAPDHVAQVTGQDVPEDAGQLADELKRGRE